jgi:hypothetical protein
MTRLDLVLTDLDCLKKAIEDLGFTVTDTIVDYNSRTLTTYNGEEVVCGIRTSGGKQRFGFTKQKDGSFRMVGDSYGTGLNTATLQKQLNGRYVLHKSAKELRKKGFTNIRIPKGVTGKVSLTASRMV